MNWKKLLIKMWGDSPWDNDSAADWFSLLMEKTDLPSIVRSTFKLINTADFDSEQVPKLRAAVYCILKFGHVYIWPINDLDNDLRLAIKATKIIINDSEYCYSKEITSQVEQELSDLQLRLIKK